MMWAALLFLASGAAETPAPVESRGARIASAEVTVRILRPVVVRQSGGWQQGSADDPVPQVSRRPGQILIEFE